MFSNKKAFHLAMSDHDAPSPSNPSPEATPTPAAKAKASRKRPAGKKRRKVSGDEAAYRREKYLAKRHHGRVLAMQMLFEQDVAQHDLDEILERMQTDPDEPVQEITGEYAIAITTGVREHRETIDERIAAAAPAFPLGQLASIDRNVLRIAIWEMLHSEVPVRVAINEAVEIAKHYGGPSSGKFVNGVLGTIARAMPQPSGTATPEPSGDEAPTSTADDAGEAQADLTADLDAAIAADAEAEALIASLGADAFVPASDIDPAQPESADEA